MNETMGDGALEAQASASRVVCVRWCSVCGSGPSHKVKRRFPRDTVVVKSSIILELRASKDQALLIERDACGSQTAASNNSA